MRVWILAAFACVFTGAPQVSAQTETWRAGQEFDDCNHDGSCPVMVVLPSGRFLMGSDRETGRGRDEGPPHRVRIATFAAGKYEITFAQWDACAADGGCRAIDDDAGWGRGRQPAINLSWDDAQAYVQWLSRKTGQHYRLLSESEWEYAARAGTHTPFPSGWDIGAADANYRGVAGHAMPVGSYAANRFGLYDVEGNVWEWVEDCYAQRYSHLPANGLAHEADACIYRVARSGSWDSFPAYVRSANRDMMLATAHNATLGFRVARDLR